MPIGQLGPIVDFGLHDERIFVHAVPSLHPLSDRCVCEPFIGATSSMIGAGKLPAASATSFRVGALLRLMAVFPIYVI